MNSMQGARGSNMSNQRGLDPRQKHISGHHRYQNFTPEMMQLFQQMMQQLDPESYLSKLSGGDEETFNQIEAPAWRQLAGIQGNLASRFSQPGLGARKSSAFQNTMQGVGSDFALQLQAQRQGLQRQAIMDLQGLGSELLNKKPYGLQEKGQKQSSGWGSAVGAGLGAGGGYLASGGNPWAALKGGQLGYDVGSGF